MAIYKLGDCFEIISGRKNISKKGKTIVVGSGGIFGTTSDKETYNSYTFSLPRKGTMKIFQYNQSIFNVDTAFLVGNKKNNKIIKKYLFYFLKNYDNWKNIINGSTRPATRISDPWKKLIDIIEHEKLNYSIFKIQKNDLNNRHYWTSWKTY